MKRDLDLVRQILLTVEEAKPGQQIDLEDFRKELPERLDEVSAHVELLDEAGYLDAIISQELTPSGPRQFFITKIEWAGYDYLDAVRDAGIWAKTKEKLKSVGGGTTLDIAKAVATKLITDSLGV